MNRIIFKMALFMLIAFFAAGQPCAAASWVGNSEDGLLLAKKDKHKHKHKIKKKHKHKIKPTIEKKVISNSYYYYPDQHVYYHPGKQIYFYRVGNNWIRSATLPKNLRNKIKRHVIVKMNSNKPYLFFNDHKIKYPNKPVILKYHYYPGINAYYDPNSKIYFYRVGGAWQKSPHLPDGLRARIGKPVNINLNTDKPYIYYDKHKVKYPGKPVIQKYYYYPGVRAYYNPARKIYFYRIGDTWKEVAHLPDDIHVKLRKPVTVNLDTDKPYTYFDKHKKQYPVEKKVYKFFPTLRIYHDPESKVWFRLEGTTWKKYTEPPADVNTTNKKEFTIKLDSDKPFQFFDIHKKEYGDDDPK